MCRLAIMNREYLKKTSKKELLVFLDLLEKSCGGHGNGMAFVDNGKVTFTIKGQTLTNKNIVDIIYNPVTPLPDWFMYHTRVASAGSIKDENCHPYVNEDGSFALMMNGTENKFAVLGEERDITDTQVIYEIYEAMNYPIKSLSKLSPRFMGVRNGKVFATNPDSQYQSLKFIENEGAICIASEFPKDYEGTKTMKLEYAWFEGDKIEVEPEKVYANTNVGYDPDWWKKVYGYNQYGVYTGKGTYNIIRLEDEKETEVEGFTLDEVKDKLDKFKELNKAYSFTSLQQDIDDYFGYSITIEGSNCYIEVLDTKQIIIINENGEVIEIE